MPDPPDADLLVHLQAWRPLAERVGRQLSPDDAREICRNLAALLLELRAAEMELEEKERDREESPDE